MSPLRALLAACLIGAAASGAAGQTAEDLFGDKDYAGAARLWQEAAAAGSAEAKLALGMLADQGLGQPRNPQLALQWYLAAASQGLAEAQFNVAVMLDAGIGVQRDPGAALIWYARAALRGHPRAQYNIGMLYRAGEGTPPSPHLAAYWFQRAKTIPAARTQLDKLPKSAVAPGPPPPPNVVFQSVGQDRAELVWLPGGGADAASFVVEIVESPEPGGDYRDPVALNVTQASGLLADFAAPRGDLLWRVSSLSADGTRYAAAGWQAVGLPGGEPKGRVTFAVPPDHPSAMKAAQHMARDLRRSGLWVRVRTSGGAGAGATSVSYSYGDDQALASRVAQFLPVLRPDEVIRLDPGATLPGEIMVEIAAAPEQAQN